MGDSKPVSRVNKDADMIELSSHTLTEFDDVTVLDSATTQDARPMASVRVDKYLPPVTEVIDIPEPPLSRQAKPSGLYLYTRPYTVIAPPITLQQGVLLLKNYLKRQKVVDLKRVKGVYLVEDVIKNPDRYPGLEKKSKELSRLKRIPRTFAVFTQETITTSSEKKATIKKKPTIVFVPLQYVRLLRGSQAERNSFDSMLYHEVEGHGVDFGIYSDYMLNFFKFYGQVGVLNSAAMHILMIAFEDVREVCAYLTELDRLVTKLNFHRNQNVITTHRKDVVENHLVFHLTNILDPSLNNKGELSQGANAFSIPFIKDRFQKVSPQTRRYFRKVLREKGWRGPIPF